MEVVIPARFNGPPNSGQGGYVCGLLAGLAPPAAGYAVVTLLAPPPLDTPMRLEPRPRRSHLWLGDDMIATVGGATRPIAVVVARREERRGRTAVNLTSVYGPDGDLVATSTAQWTALDTEGV